MLAGASTEMRPMLCETNAEALAKAQNWLEQNPDCEAIDVLIGDVELFRVGRPATP